MKQYKKIFQLKNTAKDKLDGKYSTAISILLLSSLISSIASLVINSVATTTANTIYYTSGNTIAIHVIYIIFDLILLAANILLGVMNAGITLTFLNMACGQPYNIRDLFYGFGTDSKKILLITAAQLLCQAVCLWPYQYILQIYMENKESIFLIYTLIAFLAGMCIYIPISLRISLAYYMMLDFPQYDAKETLTLCWRTTKDHWKRLFLLDLSFIPMALLCILSFGIGFLWLNPYMQMTYTQFYLDMMSPTEV